MGAGFGLPSVFSLPVDLQLFSFLWAENEAQQFGPGWLALQADG